jgi:hypothetical protein
MGGWFQKSANWVFNLQAVIVEGEWGPETAGGCMNTATWIKNPKINVDVQVAGQITIALSRPKDKSIPVQSRYPTTPSTDTPFIGFYIFKSPSGLLRSDIVFKTRNFLDSSEGSFIGAMTMRTFKLNC